MSFSFNEGDSVAVSIPQDVVFEVSLENTDGTFDLESHGGHVSLEYVPSYWLKTAPKKVRVGNLYASQQAPGHTVLVLRDNGDGTFFTAGTATGSTATVRGEVLQDLELLRESV